MKKSLFSRSIEFSAYSISRCRLTTYCLPQAQHKQSNQLAAAKMCALEGEDDLSDFMIEIDILSECKHSNIVELHEAYFIEGKLWVCYFIFNNK